MYSNGRGNVCLEKLPISEEGPGLKPLSRVSDIIDGSSG
jgi:hypothetical protein